MPQKIHEAAGKMTKLCRRIAHVNFRWRLLERVSYFRDFFRFLWERLLVCSTGQQPVRYRRISRTGRDAPPPESLEDAAESGTVIGDDPTTAIRGGYESDSDLVTLKISILGDCQIGKTSFVVSFAISSNFFSFQISPLKFINPFFFFFFSFPFFFFSEYFR